MPLYQYEFEVEPTSRYSSFPIDMLRYDSCYPATETDSGNIVSTLELRKGKGMLKEPVKVRKFTNAANWYPTDGRWESFGWQIVPSSFDKRKL